MRNRKQYSITTMCAVSLVTTVGAAECKIQDAMDMQCTALLHPRWEGIRIRIMAVRPQFVEIDVLANCAACVKSTKSTFTSHAF